MHRLGHRHAQDEDDKPDRRHGKKDSEPAGRHGKKGDDGDEAGRSGRARPGMGNDDEDNKHGKVRPAGYNILQGFTLRRTMFRQQRQFSLVRIGHQRVVCAQKL